jgi:YVTN family beta-propeller protein
MLSVREIRPVSRCVSVCSSVLVVALALVVAVQGARAQEPEPVVSGTLGPGAVLASPDGKRLYVANEDAHQLAVVDPEAGDVLQSIPLPASPSGMALAPDGKRLYVTCAAPESSIAVIDTASFERVRTFAGGHTARGPTLSPDGKRLYVCNQFNDNVSVFDLPSGKELASVAVTRQPVAAAASPDGYWILVANHLPLMPALSPLVRAEVTVIDARTFETKSILLPDGAINLQDVCISPDGKFAFVSHVLGNHFLVTSQVGQGWISTSSLSVIDLEKMAFDSNALLDDFDRGAANPWGVHFADGGKTVCVVHSGTHEMSVIDIATMLKEIRYFHENHGPMGGDNPMGESRRRVKLPGKGPRGITVIGSTAYVTEYFSDTLAAVDLEAVDADYQPRRIYLGPKPFISDARRGEMVFHDATLCFEHWQSCATCHPQGRADALNWDLMNDSVGTPKNTKSLLYAHRTPPAMATGIRASAEVAVRAGFEHILFVYGEHEKEARAVDTYLRSLRPVPSPYLVDERLSPRAERGKRLFESDEVGCAACHPAPLYTDMQKYRVKKTYSYDHDEIDTPTLIEAWRTAPYLYDGRYITVRDVLVEGEHGDIDGLTEQQIDELVEFVLSL